MASQLQMELDLQALKSGDEDRQWIFKVEQKERQPTMELERQHHHLEFRSRYRINPLTAKLEQNATGWRPSS
ncbi:hypothetical protein E2562_031477 [Oryza meyeriana var. granulata]|uniref:Uncharacterized protein n=1 Tax=Oryza meyeriana var. granulata TaxID=110450 RepID=A0A6G1ERS2_9ORYZ|nr:hypothetical protein E2562_031477 [Oryza meyeriana var. granulata]